MNDNDNSGVPPQAREEGDVPTMTDNDCRRLEELHRRIDDIDIDSNCVHCDYDKGELRIRMTPEDEESVEARRWHYGTTRGQLMERVEVLENQVDHLQNAHSRFHFDSGGELQMDYPHWMFETGSR